MCIKKEYLLVLITIVLLPFMANAQKKMKSATVPMILDHNRMLVDVELQRKDGTWRKARLWVDSGSPDFFISEQLARDLGIEFSVTNENPNPVIEFSAGTRIGGMPLDFSGVSSKISTQPFWLFSAAHNDGNIPATLLKKYHIIFDYPKQQLTIAEPGSIKPRGIAVPAAINQSTGIIQIDAVIDDEKFSFALDNGASYSFISEEILDRFSEKNSGWPKMIGAVGCANMWGWWPRNEQAMQVMRIPEIKWGPIQLVNIALVGVPKFSEQGPTLGEWYSQKTAYAVNGFLGPNAFKSFRVEIDYTNSTVYFEKGSEFDEHDMDIVGLTIQPQPDGSFKVIGVTAKEGKPLVDAVEPGDLLLQVGNLKTSGSTLGTVVDALRGKPGYIHTLLLERKGKQFKIKAKVERQL